MTPHNSAHTDSYGELVLMPGDPLRSKHIAHKFLSKVLEVNSVRGCLGYTGYYNGEKVSIQASGMGQPSLAIYANELFDSYGVRSIVRIGTCGVFDSSIALGEIVMPFSASTDSSMSRSVHNNIYIAPCCDYKLLRQVSEVLDKMDSQKTILHVGPFFSTDHFYQDDPKWWLPLAQLGHIGVDMETHYLYFLAMKKACQALTVNIAVDNLDTGETLSSNERVKCIDGIMESLLNGLLPRYP